MVQWIRIVETNCKDPKREAEYIDWYKNLHFPDLLKSPGGIKSCTLTQRHEPAKADEGKFVAFYNIETDDFEKSNKAYGEYLQTLINTGRISDLAQVVKRQTFRKI